MVIRVLLFGRARELVEGSVVELEVGEPATVGAAFDLLRRRHPKLGEMERSLLFAVNEEYATREARLVDGDTLAILPPVSGGDGTRDIFEITTEPIDLMGLRARLITGDSGAVVIFDGVGRNNTAGRLTRFLEYEGYVEMAQRTMEQIGREIRERWPINRIGMIHRLGRVDVSESSVVIVITSPHRKMAFEACHYAIDRLKQIVPIWKKEHFEDGEVWVEGSGQ